MPQPTSKCITIAGNAESYAVEAQASVTATDEVLRDRLEMAVTNLQPPKRISQPITPLARYGLWSMLPALQKEIMH